MGRKTVYNRVVTNEEYAQVNNENKQLLKMFLRYMKSVGRAEGTIKVYESNLKIAFIWILRHADNKSFIEFNKRDMMMMQGDLMEELNLSPKRIRNIRSAMSSLSKFISEMLDDEYPGFINIINTIEAPPNNAVRKKTVYSDEEIQSILDKLVEDEYYQIACGLSLALTSGARKVELTRFKTNFFTDESLKFGGSLYETPEEIRTKGRGGKMLKKYILAKEFQPYLDMWMKEREEDGVDNEYLLVRSVNGEWVQALDTTLDSWAKTINRISKQIGVDKHFYWHSCRHYYTTHLSKAGLPAEVIKEISGWESIDMVSLYDDTELSDRLENYFTADGIVRQEQKGLEDL